MFKEFALRGNNVVDIAIGIVLGVAFGKIITAIVNKVLLPPIGVLLGGTDFSSLSITLRTKLANAPVIAIQYGLFLNTLIDFIIIALVTFWVVKQLNKVMGAREDVSGC